MFSLHLYCEVKWYFLVRVLFPSFHLFFLIGCLFCLLSLFHFLLFFLLLVLFPYYFTFSFSSFILPVFLCRSFSFLFFFFHSSLNRRPCTAYCILASSYFSAALCIRYSLIVLLHLGLLIIVNLHFHSYTFILIFLIHLMFYYVFFHLYSTSEDFKHCFESLTSSIVRANISTAACSSFEFLYM